jgi:hypothetical protein
MGYSFCIQESLEARNNRESCRVSERKDVRNLFEIWVVVLNKLAFFTFWILLEAMRHRQQKVIDFKRYFLNIARARLLRRVASPPIMLRQFLIFIYLFFIHVPKQVPIQANLKDCGCFTVYFAKKFFLSPDSTVALIKVILFDPL